MCGYIDSLKVCVAIARELLGFVWDIGQHVAPEA